MKFKFFQLLFIFGALSLGTAQDDSKKEADVDPLDLKIGDEAPSFALMYAPGKFQFLKNWSEVEGKNCARMLPSQIGTR